MNEIEAATEIAHLSELLDKYNYHYYVLSESLISDFEFDYLCKNIEEIERDSLQLTSPESPAQAAGCPVTKEC